MCAIFSCNISVPVCSPVVELAWSAAHLQPCSCSIPPPAVRLMKSLLVFMQNAACGHVCTVVAWWFFLFVCFAYNHNMTAQHPNTTVLKLRVTRVVAVHEEEN